MSQTLTLEQWCDKAGLNAAHVSNDQRLFTAWFEGKSWENYVPRHVAIERAAQALLEHINPDWTLWCDMYEIERDAVEALRRALEK